MITCGFVAYCGRPVRHRGHHGGWRTHVSGVAPDALTDRMWGAAGDEPGADIGPQTVRAMAEFIHHGEARAAADCMGVAEQTLKNHLTTARLRTGAISTAQAVYAVGWTAIPPGVMPREHQRIRSEVAS